MFEFFNFARKRRLNYASEALPALSEATGIGLVQLQTLQMVAQQVVLSLEGSIEVPGAAKKALALKFDGDVTPSALGELLEQLDIVAPDSLDRSGNADACDTAIEASVKLLKALDSQVLPRAEPVVPSFKLDISGRPKTGNMETGLSL